MKFIDRTGQRFGRLIVLEQAGRDSLKKVLWKCRCDCGVETTVVVGSLVTGNTTSCGCYLKEKITKHGGAGKGSYNTWRAMIRRCTISTDKDYPRYGGRGVSVCPAWMDYRNFAVDMGEPQDEETLDRIDTYGNYELTNCRWSLPKIQARNIRIPKSSKTGVTGVLFHNGKYYAAITVKKKKYYSSVCNTIEEATFLRKELEARYWI